MVHTKKMNLMSYNLNRSTITNLNGSCNSPIGSESICMKNIVEFIKKQNKKSHYDIIALQEANDYKKIVEKLYENGMSHFKVIHHSYKSEDLILLFDETKYKLVNKLLGTIQKTQRRPYMVAILRDITDNFEFCVINVHCGHKKYSGLPAIEQVSTASSAR